MLGNRRALAQTLREIDLFDRDDRRFLAGKMRSPQERFNAGQKVNAILTAAFAVLFFVSGLLLWYGERDTRFRLGGTVFLHDALMYLSVVIVAGHLYLSLIHPTTRHALRGITLGTVREDWARKHHSKWADAANPQKRLDGHASAADPTIPAGVAPTAPPTPSRIA
jgi:formate dehydrogenase subunit gamma